MVCVIDDSFLLSGCSGLAYHVEVSIIDGSPRLYEKGVVYIIYSLFDQSARQSHWEFLKGWYRQQGVSCGSYFFQFDTCACGR